MDGFYEWQTGTFRVGRAAISLAELFEDTCFALGIQVDGTEEDAADYVSFEYEADAREAFQAIKGGADPGGRSASRTASPKAGTRRCGTGESIVFYKKVFLTQTIPML